MISPLSSLGDQTNRIAELSDEYMVSKAVGHWLIVGPTGLFVIGSAGTEPEADALRAVRVAHRLRDLLSLNMAWVPFVDVLLIATRTINGLGCSVVSPSMLESVIIDGHRRMDEDTLLQIQRVLPRLAQDLESGRPSPVLRPA